MGTYNAIEAAAKLGIKKIVFASSVTVYGVVYGYGHVEYPSFPCDEEVDVNPMDTYAISKMCGERIARGFARRFGMDVHVLRLGAVVAPDKYGTEIKGLVEETKRRRMVGWSYADVRDLGRMADLCIKTDGLGYQVSMRRTIGLRVRRGRRSC
jgi:nucleoside-diphosphate-sugar epimerase